MQENKALLAPYGATQLICLSAKVGKRHPESNSSVILAPYGSLELLRLSSKVGKGGDGPGPGPQPT